KLENPILMRHKERIEAIKRDILESIIQQQATDRIQEDFYTKQIADLERQLSYLPVAERRFVSIQRRYSLLENLYVFLMQKKAEADISKASTTSDIIVVNPPMRSG